MNKTDHQITIDHQAHHVVLEFYSPQGNALNSVALKALTQAVHRYSAMPEIKAIVLQSQGEGAFCGGASFDELMQLKTPIEFEQFFKGFARLITALLQSSKLTVVVVQGKAVGGAVGLMAAADFCWASEAAAIRLSEIQLGIGPFVIAPQIIQKIGRGKFQELLLQPQKWHSAQWAYEVGLIQGLTSPNALKTELDMHLEHIATWSTEAIALNKRLLYPELSNLEYTLGERAKVTAHLALGDYTQDKIRKFKTKK